MTGGCPTVMCRSLALSWMTVLKSFSIAMVDGATKTSVLKNPGDGRRRSSGTPAERTGGSGNLAKDVRIGDGRGATGAYRPSPLFALSRNSECVQSFLPKFYRIIESRVRINKT